MTRLGRAAMPWLVSFGGLLASVGFAHAEPSTAAPPAAPNAPPASRGVAGFSLLATGSYGVSTHEVRGMDLAPYGAGFGLDAGFTFPVGFHLGAYFNYSLGRTTTQHRDPLLGRAFDFDADTSSINTGLSVAYDVPIYVLVLRYNLGLGVTSLNWDFGDVKASSVRYGDAKDPNVGFHFAPGAALLFPHGKFMGGIGFDYLVQASGTIPSAFFGKLLVGVRL